MTVCTARVESGGSVEEPGNRAGKFRVGHQRSSRSGAAILREGLIESFSLKLGAPNTFVTNEGRAFAPACRPETFG